MSLGGGIEGQQWVVRRHDAAACGLGPFGHGLPVLRRKVMNVGAAVKIEYYGFRVVLGRHLKHLHVSNGILNNLTRKDHVGRNLYFTLVCLVSHGLIVGLRVHLVQSTLHNDGHW